MADDNDPLVAALTKLKNDTDNPRDVVTLSDAIERIEEMEALFDMQWEASMRAIKRWQGEHPGNELVWPDSADLLVWLMGKVEPATV